MKNKDFEIIKKLIEIMKEENLTEIEIKKPFFKIKLLKESLKETPKIEVKKEEIKERKEIEEIKEIKEDNIYILKSPLVGTFYRAPSPESPPYVEIGDEVKKGDILCIIEAMKIMNEIESEVDGKIIDILVENAKPVEFGQALFKIEVRK
ncbi:MAG: acetyl-CoA carboxylase biotin carboxyl carrier protein [candidate division WOR-3 bacterium]|uniref:Biotin carboxyl carrier protein of acetyl-CoA carboxylase n=1 Tax=candidate division WOR-3 bacterium TaxID=2052148 RepID=A0A7V3ZSS4_UNCW3